MHSIYSLKPGFQRVLRPVAHNLVRVGLTANHITVSTCLLSASAGLFLTFSAQSRRWLLILPAFLFFRMALNAIDGIMAREYGQKSSLGAYLNELSDVVSDAFLYLPFAYLPGFDPLWIGTVIVLAIISEMAGTVSVRIGASRRYDGPMGKSDRALIFGMIALWAGSGLNFSPWTLYAMPRMVALLLVITILNRVRNGVAETAGPDVNSQVKTFHT